MDGGRVENARICRIVIAVQRWIWRRGEKAIALDFGKAAGVIGMMDKGCEMW